MDPPVKNLLDALEGYDREQALESATRAEEQRQQANQRFPSDAWKTMSLEAFALGHDRSRDSFCYLMEFGTPDMGSMRGGSSHKHLIYKRKDKDGWYFDETYSNEGEAWEAVRGAFLRALDLARQGQWSEIDELSPLEGGAALRCKALYTYFPEELLPVYSKDHLRHFLRLLGTNASLFCP